MKIEVLTDADAVAQAVAAIITAEARTVSDADVALTDVYQGRGRMK